MRNSVLVTLLTVVITTVLAVPASYALAFVRLKIRILPISGLYPQRFFRNFGNYSGISDFSAGTAHRYASALVLLYSGSGVPLMVWLVTNYFREIPMDLVEAAELDGCTKVQTFFHIMIL